MFDPRELSETATRLRLQLQSELKTLSATAADYELIEPQAEFNGLHAKLEEVAFNTLVVGEVSRGKSSLINALVGRDILPTDENATTCIAVMIRHAKTEAFRARYTNGAVRTLTHAEFLRLASQKEVNAAIARGESPMIPAPTSDSAAPDEPPPELKALEVDTPFAFLPGNVTLIDTCGDGGTYAMHRLNTLQMLAGCHAVIYVTDSTGGPLSTNDEKLIEAILEKTPHLFFVQTKTDKKNKSEWEMTLARNEEILRDKFPNRLTDTHVWPISNELLKKAATATGPMRETLLKASGYDKFQPALQYFLHRVAGWSRTADALNSACAAHLQGRQTLSRWLNNVKSDSKKKLESELLVLESVQDVFELEWGTGKNKSGTAKGVKRRELLENMQRVQRLTRLQFTQSLIQGGAIEASLLDRIDKLTSATEAKNDATSIVADFACQAQTAWSNTCKDTEKSCRSLLVALSDELAKMAADFKSEVTLTAFSGDFKIRDGLWDLVTRARSGPITVTWAANAISYFVPLTAIVTVPIAVWTFVKELFRAGEDQLEAAKNDIIRALTKERLRVHGAYFNTRSGPTPSIVDEFFAEIAKTYEPGIDEVVKFLKAKLDKEIDNIRTITKSSLAQNAEKAARLEKQLANWADLNEGLQKIGDELRDLENRTC